MSAERVLLVGLRASSVDFSKWPEISREVLERAAVEVGEGLRKAGFAVRYCLTDDGATAHDELAQTLDDFRPDIVSIGAGVRVDPDHLRLFEDMVNLVHERAPGATLAFNTDPMDTIRSVRRAAERRARSGVDPL
ncbi:MAG: hypothetical protein AAFU73_05660 [Planctomycetota bacterium]